MREHADMAHYAASKFDDIASGQSVSPIFDPGQHTIALREAIGQQRRIIVNLAKGRLSTLNARLVGHLILALALDAGFDREPNGSDLWSIYVDEAASFPANNLERGLAEGRKFGIGLVLAHQHLRQFPPSARDAVLGNSGTTIAFRLSPDDALVMSSHMGVKDRQLISLPDLHAYIRTAIPHHGPSTFSLRLQHPANAPQTQPIRELDLQDALSPNADQDSASLDPASREALRGL